MTSREVLEFVIDKLAFILEQHMTTVRDIETLASKLDAGGRDRESLARAIENLRSLRESISQILDVIANNINDAPDSFLDDAFALIGYYVEAGAKSEARALEHAARYMELSGEMKVLDEVVAKARIILSNINLALKI
ncbi:MAG: hypothetical protein LRS46_04040 [Desulfurococcales archaeon]|nr:hypothetical protein [Desulfurococcales archaeon]